MVAIIEGARDWVLHAECRQYDPEMFFPQEYDSRERLEARERKKLVAQICGRCPVASECLDDAILHGDTFGIRGGFNMATRRPVIDEIRQSGPSRPRRVWTPEEDELIRGPLPAPRVAIMTGRSTSAVRARRTKLCGVRIAPPRPWTPEEIEMVRSDMSIAEISRITGRHRSGVAAKRRRDRLS